MMNSTTGDFNTTGGYYNPQQSFERLNELNENSRAELGHKMD